MKAASLGYLTREGFRNIWVNRLLSLATVVVLVSCLIIVGSGSLIFLNINSVLDLIEGQNVVMVYVNDDADDFQTQLLGVSLQNLDNVKKVEFVPREEAFERQKEAYGDKAALLEGLSADILPDAYKVTVDDLELFDETVKEIKKQEHVLQIHENSELAGKLASIRNAVSYISLGIVAILFFVSLFIVSNTIRITIYNRRLEISIMKAVGATDTFIRIPFVVEGAVIGIVSALLAEGILYFCYRVATETIVDTLNTTDIVKYGDMAWILLGLFLGIGLIAGILGSAIMIGKYLRKEGSEFTAI